MRKKELWKRKLTSGVWRHVACRCKCLLFMFRTGALTDIPINASPSTLSDKNIHTDEPRDPVSQHCITKYYSLEVLFVSFD